MAKLSTQFFKAMAPGFKKRLLIPVAFYRSLDGMKLDEALIKSCQGSWHVKVERTVDELLYFEEGWKDFVKHHSLKLGDFVFFEHKGNMIFHARVYQLDGCEKELPPPTNLSNRRMTTSCEAQRHCHCQSSKGKKPMNAAMPSTSNDPPHFRIFVKKSHGVEHKAYVTIPVEFVKSTKLSDRSKMILRIPSGKQWPVNLGTWQGGPKDKSEFQSRRTAIRTRGWIEFYKKNELKIGDVLTFVLRKMPISIRKPVLMDVEISRHPAP